MAGQKLTNIKGKCAPEKWADLDKYLDQLGITPEKILAGILNIAENGKTDKDKLKAWDLLAKFAGMKPPERILVSSLDNMKIEFSSDED